MSPLSHAWRPALRGTGEAARATRRTWPRPSRPTRSVPWWPCANPSNARLWPWRYATATACCIAPNAASSTCCSAPGRAGPVRSCRRKPALQGYRDARLVIDSRQVGDLYLLTARQPSAIEQLSNREGDVALLFSEGKTTSRSPATSAWRRTPCAITYAPSIPSSASTTRRASPTCCTSSRLADSPPPRHHRFDRPAMAGRPFAREKAHHHRRDERRAHNDRGDRHMTHRTASMAAPTASAPRAARHPAPAGRRGRRRRPQRPRFRRPGGHHARRALPAGDPRP